MFIDNTTHTHHWVLWELRIAAVSRVKCGRHTTNVHISVALEGSDGPKCHICQWTNNKSVLSLKLGFICGDLDPGCTLHLNTKHGGCWIYTFLQLLCYFVLLCVIYMCYLSD